MLTPAEYRLGLEYGTYTDLADRLGLTGKARSRAIEFDKAAHAMASAMKTHKQGKQQ